MTGSSMIISIGVGVGVVVSVKVAVEVNVMIGVGVNVRVGVEVIVSVGVIVVSKGIGCAKDIEYVNLDAEKISPSPKTHMITIIRGNFTWDRMVT